MGQREGRREREGECQTCHCSLSPRAEESFLLFARNFKFLPLRNLAPILGVDIIFYDSRGIQKLGKVINRMLVNEEKMNVSSTKPTPTPRVYSPFLTPLFNSNISRV